MSVPATYNNISPAGKVGRGPYCAGYEAAASVRRSKGVVSVAYRLKPHGYLYECPATYNNISPQQGGRARTVPGMRPAASVRRSKGVVSVAYRLSPTAICSVPATYKTISHPQQRWPRPVTVPGMRPAASVRRSKGVVSVAYRLKPHARVAGFFPAKPAQSYYAPRIYIPITSHTHASALQFSPLEYMMTRHVRWAHCMPHAGDMRHLRLMADRGLFKVQVERVFPWWEADEAYRRAADGHARGKIVIDFNAMPPDDTMPTTTNTT
ncbi:hypothetical protein evm_003922 [Chilo suppressalis]|nr:hypothetical protein evm_003922 [Chilo suppressalis]